MGEGVGISPKDFEGGGFPPLVENPDWWVHLNIYNIYLNTSPRGPKTNFLNPNYRWGLTLRSGRWGLSLSVGVNFCGGSDPSRNYMLDLDLGTVPCPHGWYLRLRGRGCCRLVLQCG